MIAIAKIDTNMRLQFQPFLNAFRFASLLAALTLFTALPSYAWTYYAGASVGSNGTVYGWGVTDVTYSNMNHMAYVTTTLTSPVKHRQVYSNVSRQNSVRADVYLPFDPNDLGNYVDTTISSGWCYFCNCWLLYNVGDLASANNLVSITVTRQSLTSTSASGSPAGAAGNPAFTYSVAGFGNVASYTTQNANANPNTASIIAPSNLGGQPTPGALATLTAAYNAAQQNVSKNFPSATFGLSCYYTALETDWGDPTQGTCGIVTYFGTQYSGTSDSPSGLPARTYCNAFLGTLKTNGSGVLKDGTTKVKYLSGSIPTWTFTVVSVITGADNTPVVANQTLARDRAIIGGSSSIHVQLASGTYLANDVGDPKVIVGYRLDLYRGAGKAVCANYSNPIVVGTCDVVSLTCPGYTIP